MQKQEKQVNSLQTQLDKVDEKLDQLTSVYSPSITAEVTLDIRDGK